MLISGIKKEKTYSRWSSPLITMYSYQKFVEETKLIFFAVYQTIDKELELSEVFYFSLYFNYSLLATKHFFPFLGYVYMGYISHLCCGYR